MTLFLIRLTDCAFNLINMPQGYGIQAGILNHYHFDSVTEPAQYDREVDLCRAEVILETIEYRSYHFWKLRWQSSSNPSSWKMKIFIVNIMPAEVQACMGADLPQAFPGIFWFQRQKGLTLPSTVSEPGQHWFEQWIVAYSVPSHYLNQWWFIVNWTLRNELRWNFNQNIIFFIHKNASESIVCEMVAILSRGRWVIHLIYSAQCDKACRLHVLMACRLHVLI